MISLLAGYTCVKSTPELERQNLRHRAICGWVQLRLVALAVLITVTITT